MFQDPTDKLHWHGCKMPPRNALMDVSFTTYAPDSFGSEIFCTFCMGGTISFVSRWHPYDLLPGFPFPVPFLEMFSFDACNFTSNPATSSAKTGNFLF